MAMGAGGTAGSVSEINVTPLIDVLLVLLIIFMVIVPVAPKGLDASLPQPSKSDMAIPRGDSTILVQVLSDGVRGTSYKINGTTFEKAEIQQKLAEIFASRQNKVMFVKGDPDLEFGKVSEVIDIGRQAGVVTIGLLTPKVIS